LAVDASFIICVGRLLLWDLSKVDHWKYQQDGINLDLLQGFVMTMCILLISDASSTHREREGGGAWGYAAIYHGIFGRVGNYFGSIQFRKYDQGRRRYSTSNGKKSYHYFTISLLYPSSKDILFQTHTYYHPPDTF
jgi:hypothetical protein